MNVKQAAERMEVSESLVYRLVEDGVIPHRRIGQRGRRGKIIITEDDLNRFLEKSKVDAH
jgi:excisionase family DNA binding protein